MERSGSIQEGTRDKITYTTYERSFSHLAMSFSRSNFGSSGLVMTKGVKLVDERGGKEGGMGGGRVQGYM
jgi:hypothetical protein